MAGRDLWLQSCDPCCAIVALSVRVLAEGVETPAERDWLAGEGVELMQGYLFARPSAHAADIHPAAWA